MCTGRSCTPYMCSHMQTHSYSKSPKCIKCNCCLTDFVCYILVKLYILNKWKCPLEWWTIVLSTVISRSSWGTQFQFVLNTHLINWIIHIRGLTHIHTERIFFFVLVDSSRIHMYIQRPQKSIKPTLTNV